MIWLIFSLISALAFGAQGTFTYYFTTKKKINSTSLNTLYHSLIVGISLVVLIIGYFINPNYIGGIVKGLGKIFTENFWIILLAGLFGAMGNVTLFNAYAAGPEINPGVMTALSSSAIIISVLLPAIIFGKTVTPRQIVGIIILLFSFSMLGDDKFKGFGELFGFHSHNKQ